MVGRQGLTRDVLLGIFAESGATSARSYLSTGNVSFDAPDLPDVQLVGALEGRIEAVLGRREPVLLRTLDHLSWLVDHDPFAHTGTDVAAVHERCVTFLPQGRRWHGPLPLASARGDVEVVAASGADVFSVTRLVCGRPGTAGPMIERESGDRVTTRNWRTIERIVRTPGGGADGPRAG